MTDRFNSANLEVKREPDMQGVGSNSPSSANVQVKNERLNGYPDDGGKIFNKIAKKNVKLHSLLSALIIKSPWWKMLCYLITFKKIVKLHCLFNHKVSFTHSRHE